MSKTIEELEKIDPGKFQELCDELLSDEYGYKGILPLGINKKSKTISGTPDSIIFQGKEATIFEYTTDKDFIGKLKKDLEKVKEEVVKQRMTIKRFVFSINRERKKIENKTPEEYIREKYGWEAHIIDLKSLKNALERSRNFNLRRRYLNIPHDFFISRKKFESLFKSRMEKRVHYSEKFLDRKSEFEFIKRFLKEFDAPVLIINANGGLGKTRFIIEAIKSIEKDESITNFDFLFNDPYQNNVQIIEHLHEISSNGKKTTVIILDDAHQIRQLAEFNRIFSERNKVKIIITTRTYASEKIKLDLKDFPSIELKIEPLKNEFIKSQLKKNIKITILDEALDYITHYCKGSPLIAEVFAKVINEGKARNLDELINCDPLQEYFNGTLLEFESQKRISEKYRPYLAIIYSTRPFSLDDKSFKGKIRQLLQIDVFEENKMLRTLEMSNLVEKVGSNLNVYPDLLGEYIFGDVFFKDIPLFSIDDLFSIVSYAKYESLIETICGIKSEKSRSFLLSIAKEIKNEIKIENNDERMQLLEHIEIFAHEVPDVTLQILKSIIYGNIVPPKEYKKHYRFTGRKHIDVLDKCFDILGLIRFELFNEVVECYSDLYLDEGEKFDSEEFKKKILEKIEDVGKYDIHIMRQKGFYYQKKLYEKILCWKSENCEKYFSLIIIISKILLSPEANYQYTSPLDPNKFHFGRPPLYFNDELKSLRYDVITLLVDLYGKTETANEKIDTIDAIFKATHYPINSAQTNAEKAVYENRLKILEFCMNLIKKDESPEILLSIEKDAVLLKKTGREDSTEVDRLLEALKKKDYYSLFRLFVGRDFEYMIHESKDLGAIRKEKQDKITDIIKKINNGNIKSWFSKINKIAKTYSPEEDFDYYNLHFFSFNLGKEKPHIAKKFIDLALYKETNFCYFLSSILKGIKCSKQEKIAYGYIYDWIGSKKFELVQKIPDVYSYIDENCIREEDVSIIENLIAYAFLNSEKRKELDRKIFVNISFVYKKNPIKITEYILELFQRADSESISLYLSYLELAHIRKQIDLSLWKNQDWHKLVSFFKKVSSLSFHEEGLLAIYARKSPLELIQLFENRIKIEKNRLNEEDLSYSAIPNRMDSIHEVIKNHPKKSDVIDAIFEIIQKEHWIYKRQGEDLLKNIFPDLDDMLKTKIEILISSNVKDKILFALKILGLYSLELTDWNILKKAVMVSQGDNEICKRVSKIILALTLGFGEKIFLKAYEKKLMKISNWENDEDDNVKQYAFQLMKSLKENIAREKKRLNERKSRIN